jgi:predicted esterase
MRSLILVLSLSLVFLSFPAKAQQADAPEIPRLDPTSADAKPLTVYQWTAEAGANDEHDGFRYTWRLPKDFTRTESYDLVVVCHGNGADYRWGAANLKPELFRPGNIVVCVDGTSEADEGGRFFREGRRDAIEFRDFVLEIGRVLPVDRIFYFGHAEGGAFAIFMASQFPGLTQGVVADASGMWTDTNTHGGIQSIPVAFLHGTADPVVPYSQSLVARDSLKEAGDEMLLVRRIQGGDHSPSAMRASECLEWCSGMCTAEADTALAAAEALLAPSGPDEHGRDSPRAFGGAYQVLQRVALETEHQVDEADDEQRAKAHALMKKIDDAGAAHVEALRKDLKSEGDLILGLGSDSGAWLGHLVALREDFRGVPSVEAFVKEINYDQAARNQAAAGKKLLEIWQAARPEKQKFEVVGDTLGESFLLDAFPSDLAAKMKEIKDKASELGLTDESIEKYGVVETWSTAWANGYKRYLEICKQWK